MQKIYSLLLSLVMLVPMLSHAQSSPESNTSSPTNFVEGKHYQVLPYPVRTRDQSKVEVVELFWYGCPHCYDFEPYVKPWAKRLPNDVDFFQSPATFNQVWETHAQTYYALETINALEKAHQPLFDALARDKRPLNSQDALADFLAGIGVNKDEFNKAFNSFGVRGKVQQASARLRSYRATGVPALVVNGKYRVDAGTAGGMKNMLEVADYLIAKERAQKAP